MKIAEICLYSAGICGVWSRVFEEAKRLKKAGHAVQVFTTNKIKGANNALASSKEIKEGILIKRFPARHLGGESFMLWDYKKETLKFKPDVIIVHSYRHLHTIKALDIGKECDARVFLVTHAPFSSGNATRSFVEDWIVKGYDIFVGPRTLKMFDKVIAITKWEIPFLIGLGLDRSKIAYIPNGIPENFFTQKSNKEEKNKILFLGRVSPVKSIETLLKAAYILKRKKIEFAVEIVGPAERDYLTKLNHLVKRFGLEDEVKFSPAIYKVGEKIKKIDSAEIFVLPSLREGMPQSLIEAMAREKIAIASDNMGAKDLIEGGKNGYLFQIGNAEMLAKCLERVLAKPAMYKKMRQAAKKSVEQFRWGEIMKRWDKLLNA